MQVAAAGAEHVAPALPPQPRAIAGEVEGVVNRLDVCWRGGSDRWLHGRCPSVSSRCYATSGSDSHAPPPKS